MAGRLYVSINANRIKPFGVSKKALVGMLYDFARNDLGLKITKKFFYQFPPSVLYGAMRLAQSGRKHNIFFEWENERDSVPF